MVNSNSNGWHSVANPEAVILFEVEVNCWGAWNRNPSSEEIRELLQAKGFTDQLPGLNLTRLVDAVPVYAMPNYISYSLVFTSVFPAANATGHAVDDDSIRNALKKRLNEGLNLIRPEVGASGSKIEVAVQDLLRLPLRSLARMQHMVQMGEGYDNFVHQPRRTIVPRKKRTKALTAAAEHLRELNQHLLAKV